MTEPFNINGNAVTLELNFKGVKRFGVAEATIFSIKKTTTSNLELPQQAPHVASNVPHASGLSFAQGSGNMKVSA